MKLLQNITCLLCLTLASVADCIAESRILLNDGTEIVGEVLSMQNGSYTIRSTTLGTLKISDRQVRQITSTPGGNSSISSANPVDSAKGMMNGQQVQSIQKSLMGDSAMLQRIMSLQSSPEMKAVLADPEVMQAIQNFDLDTLANHPKIKRLMNNQKVRAISSEVNR